MDFGGGWADLDEKGDDYLPEPEIIGPDDKGIKMYISYRKNEETGAKEKVIKKVKIVTKKKKVAKSIQRRKNILKFGTCEGKPPGPEEETTFVSSDNIYMENPGEEAAAAKRAEADLLRRLQDGKKLRQFNRRMAEKEASITQSFGEEKKGGALRTGTTLSQMAKGGGGDGKYVPVHMRGGAAAAESGKRFQDRDDEQNTLRVTNISEDTNEDDLRDLFSPFGRIQRVFLAKDKETQQSRGFAYISFYGRDNAEAAMNKLNGFGYDHLILKVEWAKPSSRDDVGSQSVMKAGIVSGYGKALPQGTGPGK